LKVILGEAITNEFVKEISTYGSITPKLISETANINKNTTLGVCLDANSFAF
jgi:hypothetical protein